MVRYVKNWKIEQKCADFSLLKHSLTGKQLAALIIKCLLTIFQVPGDYVLAFMRDGSSVNGTAMEYLDTSFTQSIDIRCFCHIISNCGKEFIVLTLDSFMRSYFILIAKSTRFRTAWLDVTGKRPISYSKIRWFSKNA